MSLWKTVLSVSLHACILSVHNRLDTVASVSPYCVILIDFYLMWWLAPLTKCMVRLSLLCGMCHLYGWTPKRFSMFSCEAGLEIIPMFSVGTNVIMCTRRFVVLLCAFAYDRLC